MFLEATRVASTRRPCRLIHLYSHIHLHLTSTELKSNLLWCPQYVFFHRDALYSEEKRLKPDKVIITIMAKQHIKAGAVAWAELGWAVAV